MSGPTEAVAPASVVPNAKLPPQIPYIIGNEGCERFSFYGMRNVLVEFLSKSMILAAVAPEFRGAEAKEVFHIFVMGVYFFPLLGGWLSDRYLGKYKTILYLSIVYCAGHACLSVFESSKPGFYFGLFLIALGSGGIKPCVSSFVGEQFDSTNKHLAKVVFDAFYWIINFGSLFASWLIPIVLKEWGASWAFGIPGVLMGIATFIFWLGRDKYVVVPPKPVDPHSFGRVVASAIGGSGRGTVLFALAVLGAGGFVVLGAVDFVRMVFLDEEQIIGVVPDLCLALVLFLAFTGVAAYLEIDRARGKHPDDEVDGVRSVLRVLLLFAPVTAFWSLFDQKASTWVLQGGKMLMPAWDVPAWTPAFVQLKQASQMQAINPLLVMLLIPLNNLVLYPALRRVGIEPTPLRRMTAGFVLAGISWVIVALFQLQIDGGASLNILWQILPYMFLTLGEVLLSATGLEFAYSQAPHKMKGVILSFWSLAVTVGGLWVLLVNLTVKSESATKSIESMGIGVTAFQMFFFAAFSFLAALAFIGIARSYTVLDNYRKAA
jgi:proton-dependent oligopeptide transporter, POT family